MSNPLDGVNSWLYHLGNVDAAEAARIGANNAGLVVIDYAHDTGSGTLVQTPAELEVMRAGKDKLIVSYLSIGEAEDYRPYWQSSWNTNPPDFLSASNPEWPDNFKVKFWDPAWQTIIFNYVDQIIASGFNGVYMDIIDAYQYWEDINPVPGMNYAQKMADFVAAIRAHALQKLASLGDTRDFVIMGQNGEELLSNSTYLNAIDGVGKEDLRFYYPNGSEGSFQPTPNGWYNGSTPYLELAEAAGVQVFVVEYLTQTRQTQYSSMLAAEIQYLSTHGIPLYVSEDRDLTSIYVQPGGVNQPIYGSAAAETVNGTIFGDTIYALAGNDSVNAQDGDDILVGGAGADALYGGTGMDTASYDTAATGVSVSLRAPSGNTGDAAGDSFTSIENLSGSAYADMLEGNDSANVLVGGVGNDALYGGAGRDVMDGGDGSDALQGGAGYDLLTGGAGADVIYGGVNDDVINGGDGRDSLYGDQGADQLYGGNDIDVLFVDSTDTVYDGGAGLDYIVWNDATVAANLDVTAHSADYFYGYNGNDIVTAIGATVRAELHGGGGNDTLSGSATVGSILMGEAGNDRLIGNTGIDHMVGGTGADTFVFGPNGGTDYIYDFKTGGADKIDFTALAGTGVHALANLTVIADYAASGWYGYSYGTGTVWLNTTAIGSTQPVAGDFLFA